MMTKDDGSPISVYFKKEMIESMKELIKRYQCAMDLGISKDEYESRHELKCLLCYPIGIDRLYHCDMCPWMIINDTQCDYTHSSRYHGDITSRINQLFEWIEIYENAEEIEWVEDDHQ